MIYIMFQLFICSRTEHQVLDQHLLRARNVPWTLVWGNKQTKKVNCIVFALNELRGS